MGLTGIFLFVCFEFFSKTEYKNFKFEGKRKDTSLVITNTTVNNALHNDAKFPNMKRSSL